MPGNDRELSASTYLSRASFWAPEYVTPSAWLEHAPFAFWLVEALRPRSLVELGTYRGFSYFAFCQAVKHLRLDTLTYAVDTWAGDEHSGFYGADVLEQVRARSANCYGAFSKLLQSTFDQAVPQFDDGSIDLLHIDGRHFYEDVRHDFETWLPKMSERSVILFHDTNVREREFGVYRFWAELCSQFPSFEFLHGSGLGVLGYGKSLPAALVAFFDATSETNAQSDVRGAYTRLGAHASIEFSSGEMRASLGAEITSLQRTVDDLQQKARSLEQKVTDSEAEGLRLQHVISEIFSSRSWKVTAPLRATRTLIRTGKYRPDR